MNREILFRGKRVDNGEWVNGYLVKKIDPLYTDIETHCILHQERDNCGCLMSLMTWTRVDVETIGQYTGLTDKNGVKIFDGDIVTVENPNISDDEYGIVKFDNDGAMFIVEFDTFTVDFGNNIDGNRCEIIGNIFDNSELLKGEENE